ncbi:MAG: hypothetical protein O3C40_34145 [Planctomycetota bacterium]|nr:hypothetical protein [Planctomycetota bacterium]
MAKKQTPTKPFNKDQDERYFKLIQRALAVCKTYRPKFGQGRKAGLTLDEFRTLYQGDPFYRWFGLDSPLLDAAHKAAGGMTSVYRQIGTGCERLFRQLLQDSLGLNAEQVEWSYLVPGSGGKPRKLSLDGRIPWSAISDVAAADRVRLWLRDAANVLKVSKKVVATLEGPVFEVRQGYKSKDSKRQNADVGNAANAYANSYLPVVVLLSSQIDDDIAERYLRAQWLILRGSVAGTPLESTYIFAREVLGYDLAGFFNRNSARIRTEVEIVIEALLS